MRIGQSLACLTSALLLLGCGANPDASGGASPDHIAAAAKQAIDVAPAGAPARTGALRSHQKRPLIQRTVPLPPRKKGSGHPARNAVAPTGKGTQNPNRFASGDQIQRVPALYALDGGARVALYSTAGDATSSDYAYNQGGTVIDNADLELIFWGNPWLTAINPTTYDVIRAADNVIGSNYLSCMTQYGYRNISVKGATIVTSDPPSTFSCKDDVGGLVWDLIDNGTFAEPEDSGGRTLYMVFMPAMSTPTSPAGGAHCDPWDYDFPADVTYAWVGWVGQGSLDTMTASFTHELVEAISDPEPHSRAWVMDQTLNGGVEIGDACWHTLDRINGMQVQSYWSQSQRACVIPFPTLSPVITTPSPSSGPNGVGTTVRIDGIGIGTQGDTTVTFGNVPATNVSCSSSSTCMATSPIPGPLGADQTVPVNVTVNGMTTNGTYFTYLAGPNCTSTLSCANVTFGLPKVTIQCPSAVTFLTYNQYATSNPFGPQVGSGTTYTTSTAYTSFDVAACVSGTNSCSRYATSVATNVWCGPPLPPPPPDSRCNNSAQCTDYCGDYGGVCVGHYCKCY